MSAAAGVMFVATARCRSARPDPENIASILEAFLSGRAARLLRNGPLAALKSLRVTGIHGVTPLIRTACRIARDSTSAESGGVVHVTLPSNSDGL